MGATDLDWKPRSPISPRGDQLLRAVLSDPGRRRPVIPNELLRAIERSEIGYRPGNKPPQERKGYEMSTKPNPKDPKRRIAKKLNKLFDLSFHPVRQLTPTCRAAILLVLKLAREPLATEVIASKTGYRSHTIRREVVNMIRDGLLDRLGTKQRRFYQIRKKPALKLVHSKA